jgi:hypothetical protein
VAGLALAFCLAFVYENTVRRRGFVPSVNDDIEIWSLTRNQVARDQRDQVVLIGASRIQADLDGDVFTEEFGGPRPWQLGIVGSSPLPVLDAFARDETFKGLLICDVMPIYFFTGIETTAGHGAEYSAYALTDKPWDQEATRLRVWLESHVAFRAPHVSPSPSNLPGLLGLRPLPRQHTVTDAMRYTHIDRRPEEVPMKDIAELADLTEQARPASEERLESDLAAVNAAVRQIQARGGRVVFTVLPVSGLRREAEERAFPRSEYWDKFAAGVNAVIPCIF